MLPSVFPRLATDSAGRVFPGVWKPLFLKFPSQDGLPFLGQSSLPTSFVSFFVFYIFSYLFLKTMVCFSGCLMSSASLQKLFCGVCSVLKCSFEEFVREKVVFPSYSSTIFTVPFFSPTSFLSFVLCLVSLAHGVLPRTHHFSREFLCKMAAWTPQLSWSLTDVRLEPQIQL